MKIIFKDGTVAEATPEQQNEVLRHTAAHILAQAVKILCDGNSESGNVLTRL